MKKISLIIFLLIVSILKSQPSSTNIKLVVDFTHYTVSGSNDSTFVKYIQFDLSDTATVSKISYTLSDLTTGNEIQKDYNFSSLSTLQDLTIKSNSMRNKKKVKISLGYFKYEEKNYTLNIKLYDVNGNLLNSTDFNFNH